MQLASKVLVRHAQIVTTMTVNPKRSQLSPWQEKAGRELDRTLILTQREDVMQRSGNY